MSDGLFGKSGGGLAGGLSGGLKVAAVALLVQQLMKHSRGSATGPEAATQPGTHPGTQPATQDEGGGLGGILGGLLGGAGGGLLGGLGGLLGGLRGHQGMEQKVDSWVRPGPNQSVSADELSRAFDPQDVDTAARQAGTDRDGLMQEVSRVLPDFVDRMTPQGRVPERETDLGQGGIGGLLSSLLGGAGRDDAPRR